MENGKKIQTILSLVMILGTASLGWINLTNRGDVQRIADNRMLANVPPDEQDVLARLWEDPLQAVQAILADHEKMPHSSPERHTPESIRSMLAQKNSDYQNSLLIVVPIPDTPYPSDLETRLRMRYSIQAALAEENYAPDNREHIGYFRLPSDPEADLPTTQKQPSPSVTASAGTQSAAETQAASVAHTGTVIPYEWFVPRNEDKARGTAVLVLWFPESRLGSCPLKRLATLKKSLTADGKNAEDKLAGVFLIGPRSSDTLKTLVNEVHHDVSDWSCDLTGLRNKLSIFSPAATTPDPLIGLPANETWADARQGLAARLNEKLGANVDQSNAKWCYFHNFVAPDDQLTDLLVSELVLRGIDLKANSTDAVLILAEADTEYGRSLPVAFRASRDNYRDFATGESGDLDWSHGAIRSGTAKLIASYKGEAFNDRQLLIHRYLRGLDQQKGQQRTDSAAQKQVSKSAEQALADALSKKRAMALGESQLDYVDRLVEDIERNPNCGAIKAVGVLGGDIYDKLILLRSIRSKLPHAVFFTTDLDARIWHPDHLPFTRNLIVASGSGINTVKSPLDKSGVQQHKTTTTEAASAANDNSGADQVHSVTKTSDSPISNALPPFRDGYQVATYEACRAAIRKATQSIPEPSLRRPSIFEIGRDGPVELKSPVTSSPHEGLMSILATVFGDLLATLNRGRCIGVVLLLLGIYAAFALWCKQQFGNWHAKIRIGWMGWHVLLSAGLLTCFYLITRCMAELPGGEPWWPNQGTSIWPTEIVRASVVCTIIGMFIWAWGCHVKSQKRLEKTYPLSTSAPRPSPDQQPASKTAGELFQEYAKKGTLERRAVRVVVATLAYICFAYGLVLLIDGDLPSRPNVRGNVARYTDTVLTLLSSSCFLALIFYVLDSVMISSQLLRGIGPEADTEWPRTLSDDTQQEFSVRPEDVNGLLDVRFAAEISAEISRLIYLPFLLQFLIILARSSYLDNWQWSASLILIFVCNILLCCASWMIMRRAAKKIRDAAIKKIKNAVDDARLQLSRLSVKSTAKSAPAMSGKDRLLGLLRIQKQLVGERRGAYSEVFQDPALMAVFLPSGIFGILTILFHTAFAGY